MGCGFVIHGGLSRMQSHEGDCAHCGDLAVGSTDINNERSFAL